MYKLCPDCCMDVEVEYSKNQDRLRCCLDHLTDPKEIEEYAWELWGEVKAYKAGMKTLQAEKARLEISLRAEKAVVKELAAGLTAVSEGLEGLKG